MIVIGTSGSTDYLKDTSDRRYWHARVCPDPAADDLAKVGRRLWADLLAAQRVDQIAAVDEADCDGIHDEDAPQQYLCSRCFSGDFLTCGEDDEDDPRREDQEQETE
jgi:hypothetical protein